MNFFNDHDRAAGSGVNATDFPATALLTSFDLMASPGSSSSSSCSQPVDAEFSRRAYVLAAPILLILGFIGNFGLIAILSKYRFQPFPITTLLKSHAITNIFYLFIGLFIGEYFRSLSNFDFQQQFGVVGCRIHVALTYALSYITTWHFVAISGMRLFMAISSPIFLSDAGRRRARWLVSTMIAVIVVFGLILAGHIFWSLSSPGNSHQQSSPVAVAEPKKIAKTATGVTMMKANTTKERCRTSLCDIHEETVDDFLVTWKVVDLICAIVVPTCLVLINTVVVLPLAIHYRSNDFDDITSTLQMVSVVSFDYRLKRRRRSSAVEVIADKLSVVLFYQDLAFIFLSLPLAVYFMLIYMSATYTDLFSASFAGNLRLIYPVANLWHYAINVIQFPALACCRTKKPKKTGINSKPTTASSTLVRSEKPEQKRCNSSFSVQLLPLESSANATGMMNKSWSADVEADVSADQPSSITSAFNIYSSASDCRQ